MTPCPTDWMLERYLLDELAPGSAERAHIASCDQCAATLAAKRALGDAYMSSPAARALADRLTEAERRPLAARAPRSSRSSRRTWRFVAIGLAATAALAAALALVLGGGNRPRSGPDAEAQVLAVEHAWTDAYLHNDAGAIDRILVGDYTLTDSRGKVTTKADDLARVRAGRTRLDAYDSFDVRVRVYGDAAVVTGRSKLSGVNDRGAFTSEFLFTDTLAYVDGRWRAVAAHISTLRP